jgi:hypothetical protein
MNRTTNRIDKNVFVIVLIRQIKSGYKKNVAFLWENSSEDTNKAAVKFV